MIREVQLEKQVMAICRMIDPYFMDRVVDKIEVWNDISRSMMIEIHASVYGSRYPKRHVIRFPSNWFEAFKERWFPSFLRDKFPVQYTVVEADLMELYPDLDIKLPDKRPVLRFATMQKDESYCW